MAQTEPDPSTQKLCQTNSMISRTETWERAEVWRQVLVQYLSPSGYITGMEKNEQARAYTLQPLFVPINIRLTYFGEPLQTVLGPEMVPIPETSAKVVLLLPPKKHIYLRID